MAWRMRARHRLREPETTVDRASDEQIVALLRACRSARDRLIVLLMARAGLRRGEVCGLRRSDVHLLVDSRRLGCEVARAHLHVVRREDNPNGAWAKSRRQRVVPLDFLVVQAFDTYEFERMTCAAAPRTATSCSSTCSAARSARRCGRTRSASCWRRRRAGPGSTPRSARISCDTPSAATSPTPGAASTWSPTCSVTPRSPRRRCICIPTPARLRAAVDAVPSPREQAGVQPVTAAALAEAVPAAEESVRVPARAGRGRAGRRGRAAWPGCWTGVPGRGRMGSGDPGAVPARRSIGCWAGRCAGSSGCAATVHDGCPACATGASPG